MLPHVHALNIIDSRETVSSKKFQRLALGYKGTECVLLRSMKPTESSFFSLPVFDILLLGIMDGCRAD